ncbi:MAG: hypothetical protein LQ343_002668 [Gyalolechia ehrenbergii]|nr:MAG: hypothetical protein LQ343_002668 [Gyalolechia ehrenbergii]
MAPRREAFKEMQESLKPSFPEFIVALFLAKSKPPHVAVRGAKHLAHIRSYIRTGHRPATDHDGARYVDTLADWKDSYQRLQQETSEQRARIYNLERELDARKGVGRREQSQQAGKRSALGEASPSGRNKKRKRTNTSMNTTTTESQRVMTSVSSQTAVVDVSTAALQCDAYLVGADPGMLHHREAALLDAIYALQKSLAQSPIIPSQTASIVVFIISQLHDFEISARPLPHHNNGVAGICRPPESTVNARTDEESGRILDPAIGRTVLSMLLAAVNELGRSSHTVGLQKQLVYSMVKFFDDLLNGICSLAAATTEASQRSKQAPVRRRSTRGKKSVAPQVPEVTPGESIMRRCRFLLNAFQALRKDRLTDQAIMEGYMFFFLQKIGRTLKVFVFGEHDEEWNAVWAGKDATVCVSVENDILRQEEKLARERQAPYLIWLLERTLVVFASEGNPGSQTQNSSQTVHSMQRKPRQGIRSDDVKIQLQQTILKEVLGDNFQELSKALDEPDDPGLNLQPWEAGKQAGVVDLFKAEVWRLIGWDCLKSHTEWENKQDC